MQDHKSHKSEDGSDLAAKYNTPHQAEWRVALSMLQQAEARNSIYIRNLSVQPVKGKLLCLAVVFFCALHCVGTCIVHHCPL